MKKRDNTTAIIRKTISLSSTTHLLAQTNADKYFGGNLSAYIAPLVLQGDCCNRCALDNSLKIQKLKASVKSLKKAVE